MSGAGGQAVGGDERVQAVMQMLQNNPSLQRFQMFQNPSATATQVPMAPMPAQQSDPFQGWKQPQTNDLAPMQMFQQSRAPQIAESSPQQSIAPMQSTQGEAPAQGSK